MSDTTAVLAEVTEQIERLRKWPNTSNLIAAWKDYASLLDMEDLFSDLDDNDAKYAAEAIVDDMVVADDGGVDRLRRHGVWMFGHENAVNEPVHDREGVATAMIRAAILASVPIEGPMPTSG